MCFILVCDRKVPILGKHTRRITSGSWSNENLLALASDDNTISVSNVEGDTIRQISVRANPQNVQFSEMKGDERSQIGENTVNTSRNKALRNPVPRNTREENTVYILFLKTQKNTNPVFWNTYTSGVLPMFIICTILLHVVKVKSSFNMIIELTNSLSLIDWLI